MVDTISQSLAAGETTAAATDQVPAAIVGSAARELSAVLTTVDSLPADAAQAVATVVSALMEAQAASSDDVAASIGNVIEQLARAATSAALAVATAAGENGTVAPMALSSPNLNMTISIAQTAAALDSAPLACETPSGTPAAVTLPDSTAQALLSASPSFNSSLPISALLYTTALHLHSTPTGNESDGGAGAGAVAATRRRLRRLNVDAPAQGPRASQPVTFSLGQQGRELPIRDALDPILISIPYQSSARRPPCLGAPGARPPPTATSRLSQSASADSQPGSNSTDARGVEAGGDGASLEECDTILECRFWSVSTGRWSAEGCTPILVNSTAILCACTHLTEFIAFEFGAAEALQALPAYARLGSVGSCTPNPIARHCLIVLLATFAALLACALRSDRLALSRLVLASANEGGQGEEGRRRRPSSKAFATEQRGSGITSGVSTFVTYHDWSSGASNVKATAGGGEAAAKKRASRWKNTATTSIAAGIISLPISLPTSGFPKIKPRTTIGAPGPSDAGEGTRRREARRWWEELSRPACLVQAHSLYAGLVRRRTADYTRAQSVMVLFNGFSFEVLVLCLLYSAPAPQLQPAATLAWHISNAAGNATGDATTRGEDGAGSGGVASLSMRPGAIFLSSAIAAVLCLAAMRILGCMCFHPMSLARSGRRTLRMAICWPCRTYAAGRRYAVERARLGAEMREQWRGAAAARRVAAEADKAEHERRQAEAFRAAAARRVAEKAASVAAEEAALHAEDEARRKEAEAEVARIARAVARPVARRVPASSEEAAEEAAEEVDLDLLLRGDASEVARATALVRAMSTDWTRLERLMLEQVPSWVDDYGDAHGKPPPSPPTSPPPSPTSSDEVAGTTLLKASLLHSLARGDLAAVKRILVGWSLSLAALVAMLMAFVVISCERFEPAGDRTSEPPAGDPAAELPVAWAMSIVLRFVLLEPALFIAGEALEKRLARRLGERDRVWQARAAGTRTRF